MSDFKHEIGDEFLNHFGQPRKIIFRASKSGLNFYTVETAVEIQTFSEDYLDEWTKIEPFFEVGDEFESDGVHVLVTHVDEEMESAWAITRYPDGLRARRESIGIITWRQVKNEVLRNRSN